MTMKKVSGDLAKNRDYLDRQLGVGESFDVLYRNVEIGKKNAALYMIDGFCKDEVMQKLLQHFIGITKEQMPEDAAEMSRHRGRRCIEPEAVFGQMKYNMAYRRFRHVDTG